MTSKTRFQPINSIFLPILLVLFLSLLLFLRYETVKGTRVQGLNPVGVEVLTPVRDKLEGNIKRLYFEPYASLILGMTIGIDDLPYDLKQKLIDTGTIHIVVVSGFNVSIIIGIVFNLFSSLKRRSALLLSIISVIFYVLLTGANPPVVRAAIMGTLAFIGKSYGRQGDALYLLFLAAYTMVFINPMYITSISFQFSFLATLGLILFDHPIRSGILKSYSDPGSAYIKPVVKQLVGDFSSTIAASVMVFPLISFYFGRISIVSPLVNTIILWTVPIITIIALIVGLLSFLSLSFVSLISWIVLLPLSYFVYVVRWASTFDFSSINFKLNLSEVIFFYLILVFIIVVHNLYYEDKFRI